MAANDPNSPRQKMINLMYLVFIAMLALNVSSEVLDGFELVEESLLRSVKSSTTRNELLFKDMEEYHRIAEGKTDAYYKEAQKVKERTDSLYNFISRKKLEIARHADGKNADPEKLEHPDDLNAAFEVMIAPGKTGGKELRERIDAYRDSISNILGDSLKREIIKSNLSTQPSRKAKENKQSWEESMFWQMPLAAAVTLMTKLQNDIRYAEGEALSTLLRNIDLKDFKVNEITAEVIPDSRIVMRGGTYVAKIVLTARDSTQLPAIIANGKILEERDNGFYRVGASSTGTFPVSGIIKMKQRDGTTKEVPFKDQYYVVEPSATIAPTLMNVLYAGYSNPIRIAAPGIPSQNISATMTNGSLTRSGELWMAKPEKIGVESVIIVTAKMEDGKTQEMARTAFRVRMLPDPLPYLEYPDENGNIRKFKGGKIPKSRLIAINEVKAAIDDDLLNIAYRVVKFETLFFDSFGNTVPEVSDGPRFSDRQKGYIQKLSKGKTFFIRGVVAIGPDGIERSIPPIEVVVN